MMVAGGRSKAVPRHDGFDFVSIRIIDQNQIRPLNTGRLISSGRDIIDATRKSKKSMITMIRGTIRIKWEEVGIVCEHIRRRPN